MTSKVVNVLNLGRQKYKSALSVQNHLVARVQSNVSSGLDSGNTLILVEHPPVYTTVSAPDAIFRRRRIDWYAWELNLSGPTVAAS